MPPKHHLSQAACQVLTAIAPGGHVEDESQAFDMAFAHLLKTSTLEATEVERIAREVQSFCRERGHWGIVTAVGAASFQ